jgi:hypothetical protein
MRPIFLFIDPNSIQSTSKLFLPVRHTSPDAIASCCRKPLSLAWQTWSCQHFVPLCRDDPDEIPRIPAEIVHSMQDEGKHEEISFLLK